MGKGGRVACIFVPWALTVASFICLLLIELGGYNKGSSELSSLYFFKADFSNLTIPANENSALLTTALQYAKQESLLSDVYDVYLWNYCTSNSTDGSISACSKRESGFVFDVVDVWKLNASNIESQVASATGQSASDISSQISSLESDAQNYENNLLGESGRKALNTYKKVAKWMFIAYQISFWTTLATIVVSLLAICSRWGSFLTWILSTVSTIFTVLAVATSTTLFAVLVGALGEVLKKYDVHLSLGTKNLIVGWIAVAASVAATLFWLFSVCCCSGKSNPHHRSNKGGLWNAEPKGQNYYGVGNRGSRGSGQVEKARGYERVSSPYHSHEEATYGDRVSLHPIPPPPQNSAYEPYRHN